MAREKKLRGVEAKLVRLLAIRDEPITPETSGGNHGDVKTGIS